MDGEAEVEHDVIEKRALRDRRGLKKGGEQGKEGEEERRRGRDRLPSASYR